MQSTLAFGFKPGQSTISFRRRSRRLLLSFLCAIMVLDGPLDFAAASIEETSRSGFISLESLGFLRKSQIRDLSSTIVTLSPNFSTEGSIIEAKFEGLGSFVVSDPSAYSIDAVNAYIGTSRKWSELHQFSLGRKRVAWSQADDFWKLGTWSPRFMWDPIHPTSLGLPGLFYRYQSKRWRVQLYGSPISIPERGTPLETVDGDLVSSSPFHVPYPERVQFENQVLDIRYSIGLPPLSQLVFNPGAAVKIRYGEARGGFGSIGYAYLPMHQPDLKLRATVDSPNLTLNAEVEPQVIHRHLVTAEVGYQYQNWLFYGSLSRDIPQTDFSQEGIITQPIGPAWISSMGARLDLGKGYFWETSFLNITESLTSRSDETDLTLSLYNRFPYRQALRSSLNLDTGARISYEVELTYDIPNSSGLLSADVRYVLGKKQSGETRWFLGVGTDWFVSGTTQGLIGQYRGEDRFRGRIAYAF